MRLGITRSAIYDLGIGRPSGLFLFGSGSVDDLFPSISLLGKVALANSPQLVLSIAYYLWNNHLGAMYAAYEYDKYATPAPHANGSSGSSNKQGLRVTYPKKHTEQRPTRFLTVPLKHGITNIVLWILLHYLASQAIFFARVDLLDHWQEVTNQSISRVGYSVLGLICFLICAILALIYAICLSVRRFSNRMPLAATCSAAISAACHPKDPWMRHHEKRVHWGVEVDNGQDADEGVSGTETMRCTFTSGEARYPEVGKLYA